MIRNSAKDTLLSLSEIDKSLLSSLSYFNANVSSIVLDYRKELIILLQNWEIILKKALIKSQVLSKVDEEYFTHNLEDLFYAFEGTSLGKRCLNYLQSNNASAIPLATINMVSLVDVRYKSKSMSFYLSLPYEDIIYSLRLVVLFLTSNGVV